MFGSVVYEWIELRVRMGLRIVELLPGMPRRPQSRWLGYDVPICGEVNCRVLLADSRLLILKVSVITEDLYLQQQR